MNLAELQAEVILITSRPDLVELTLSAVKAATLKAHQSDYYPKDIYETGLSFSTAEYEHDFEVTTFIPRFRAIKYARKYDNTNSEPGAFFELLDPINVLDHYGVARTEVCYLGGNEIHFKSSTEFQYALFGCYLNPDTATATFTSCVAINHPWAIIHEAARRIFMHTGNAEKARAQRELIAEEYALLRQGNILAAGF
jgi:hypothetical protein